ncbi:phosphatase 2C-like domain-containing protein [Pelagophyceae sp. CCMP2097]|nr:phosphatase 2C-like domain-containing protein [Pelagophyceae sp. CCMP2097]|mmetsp:Transcript_12416/g.44032  ORF Transcript_12416/g.44032 Transcript_12416/m.44032 type:complete len:402 (-) Transcript_12416:14-1219(-)
MGAAPSTAVQVKADTHQSPGPSPTTPGVRRRRFVPRPGQKALRTGERLHGVGERCGEGRVRGSRVSGWGAWVSPASQDQDRFALITPEGGTRRRRVVAGVFDGHGIKRGWGAPLAEQASAKLVAFDAAEGEPAASALDRAFLDFQAQHAVAYDAAIGRAMAHKCAAFEAQHGFKPPCAYPPEGGTTATVLVVEGDKLDVAWVGDSRCVIATRAAEDPADDGISATALTIDHCVGSNAAERARVEAAGACTEGEYLGVDGAEGMLQVTRSLGDWAHHRNSVVLAAPQHLHLQLEDGHDFLILASDGIWQRVDDAEACNFVHQRLQVLGRGCAALKCAAKDLADLAHARFRAQDQRPDDAVVIVLNLAPADTPRADALEVDFDTSPSGVIIRKLAVPSAQRGS